MVGADADLPSLLPRIIAPHDDSQGTQDAQFEELEFCEFCFVPGPSLPIRLRWLISIRGVVGGSCCRVQLIPPSVGLPTNTLRATLASHTPRRLVLLVSASRKPSANFTRSCGVACGVDSDRGFSPAKITKVLLPRVSRRSDRRRVSGGWGFG